MAAFKGCFEDFGQYPVCVECLVLGSSHWFLLFTLAVVSPDDSKGLFSFVCAGFLLFSKSHLAFSLSFAGVFPCSVPGVCPLEFMMCLQCCPGVERMFSTDSWRIIAGMCRNCSRSMVLMAAGRAGSILHLEVSRWEMPMGHAGRQHSPPQRIPLLDFC